MKKRLIIPAVAITLLGGCSVTPASLSMKHTTFDYEQLNIIDGERYKNHSEAMQLVTLNTRVLPKTINNLDDFQNQVESMHAQNTSVSISQGAQLAGLVAGAVNPLQAATSIMGQSSYRREVDRRLGYKQLFTVRQLPDSFDLSEESLSIEIMKEHKLHDDLVQQLVKQLNVKSVDLGLVTGGMKRMETTLDGQSLTLCFSQQKEISEIKKYDLHGKGCGSYTSPFVGYVSNYTGNINNIKAPKGAKLLIATTSLGSEFPVKQITAINSPVETFIYEPSLIFYNDANFKAIATSSENAWKTKVEGGVWSIVPKLIRIDGAVKKIPFANE